MRWNIGPKAVAATAAATEPLIAIGDCASVNCLENLD